MASDSLSIEGGILVEGLKGSKTLAEGNKILQMTRMVSLESPSRWRRKQTWLLHFLVAKHHLEVINVLTD